MIYCEVVQNIKCLKCKNVSNTMVRIGVFKMCKECWSVEFNVNSFDKIKNIILYENYLAWLKIYRKEFSE